MRHFKFIPTSFLNTTRAELSGMFYSNVDENGAWTIRVQLPTRAILRKTSKAKLTWVPPWVPLIDPLFAGHSFSSWPNISDRLSFWAFSVAPGHLRVGGLELNWVDDPKDILHEPPQVPDFNFQRPPRATPVTTLTTEQLENEVLLVTDCGESRVPLRTWDKFLTDFHAYHDRQKRIGARNPPHPEGFTWINELKIPNHILLSLAELG